MTELSIAIVAYHDGDDVKNAVSSILAHTDRAISKQIYIVDNGGVDGRLPGLAEAYPEVRYLSPGKNLGFGGGHNYALPFLDSRFHAILNPDILLVEDSFSAILEFMRDERIGMAAPRLVSADGKRQASCRRELTVADLLLRMAVPGRILEGKGGAGAEQARGPLGWLRRRNAYHTMQDMDYRKPFPVPFAQGSFLVVRTELFRELGGFDRRYFMYMEDADLCRRVNEKSSLWYCPYTEAVHKWERGSHKDLRLFRAHVASMARYFHKWGWSLW